MNRIDFIIPLIFNLLLCFSLNSQIPSGEYAITATSTLKPSSTANFSPDNLMDGTSASWSEGAEGNGIGEKIFLDLRYPDELRFISIKNGYGIEKYWKANARIKLLKVTDENGDSRLLSLEDSPNMRTYGLGYILEDENQLLFPGEPLSGNQFIFEIRDVYEGERWQDACITEIMLNEWSSSQFEMDENHVFKNLFRAYFNGVINEQGQLFIESEWDGYESIDVNEGYYSRELVSGDGAMGEENYRIFINGLTDEYYLLRSKYVSEISEAGMGGKLDENGEPDRIKIYDWEFSKYDPGEAKFEVLQSDDLNDVFITTPKKALSDLAGKELGDKEIWIKPFAKQAGMLSASYPPFRYDPDYEVFFEWDGNWFRVNSSIDRTKLQVSKK